MIMMAALTLAGENLFRECCNLAGKGAFHYEIWITFSGFLAGGIKVCDQPQPIRHTCPRLVAGYSSLYPLYRSHSGRGRLSNPHAQCLAAEALEWTAVVFLQVLCTEGMDSLLYQSDHQETDHKFLLDQPGSGNLI